MLLGASRFAVAALPFLRLVKFPGLSLRYVAGYEVAQGLGQFGSLFFGLQLALMGAGAWLATLLASTLWAAWVFFADQPVAQQWAGAAAVLLGLLIHQAGALRTLARSWWARA